MFFDKKKIKKSVLECAEIVASAIFKADHDNKSHK